jgi:hypothetical protein
MMELALNLAWIVLAASMYWLWIGSAPRGGATRRTQFVALVLVVLILFPVISVTDDLTATLNPAETDCCQRRGHAFSGFLSTLHPGLEFVLPTIVPFAPGSSHFAALGNLIAPLVKVPALRSIQTRPPPTA